MGKVSIAPADITGMMKYIGFASVFAAAMLFTLPASAGKKSAPKAGTLGSCYSATAAPVCYELYGARFKKYGPKKCKGKFDTWRKQRKCPVTNLRLSCDMRVDAAHNMRFFFYDQISLRDARKMCKRIQKIPGKRRRAAVIRGKRKGFDL